ncbi:MAG: GNAT family N-acetyltransferase [Pseudomonadota bacterium]
MIVEVVPCDPRDLAATGLLQASHLLMQSLFAPESNHFLSIDALCRPEIRFFVAKRGTATIGCAALAVKAGYGEVKSMFVAPEARGAKVGEMLLTKIEAAARTEGLALLRLETGDKLASAHALYQRRGFKWRGPFGAYEDLPESLFMEKKLT